MLDPTLPPITLLSTIVLLETPLLMNSTLEVKMELPFNQMFARKNAGTDAISTKTAVTTGTGTTGMAVIGNATSNLAGFV